VRSKFQEARPPKARLRLKQVEAHSGFHLFEPGTNVLHSLIPRRAAAVKLAQKVKCAPGFVQVDSRNLNGYNEVSFLIGID
jgi:hypothetical protein